MVPGPNFTVRLVLKEGEVPELVGSQVIATSEGSCSDYRFVLRNANQAQTKT